MVEKINFEQEWSFIQSEIHKEKPNNKNILKRELLFILQILLSNFNSFNHSVYLKSKKMYLNL